MSLTITIADNGNGTGGVATIAGSDSGSANTVYVMAPTASSWTSAGTRTGDGTVSLALATGLYFAYVQGTVSSAPAVSQVLSLVAITNGQTSVQEKLLNMVQSEIQALAGSISGFPPAAQIYKQMVVNDTIAKFPAVFITPAASETILGFTTNTDDYGKPVVVSIVDRNDEEYTKKMGKYLYWRQCIIRHFHGARPPGVAEGYVCFVEPAVIFDPRLPGYEYMVSAFTLRFKTREPRTP